VAFLPHSRHSYSPPCPCTVSSLLYVKVSSKVCATLLGFCSFFKFSSSFPPPQKKEKDGKKVRLSCSRRCRSTCYFTADFTTDFTTGDDGCGGALSFHPPLLLPATELYYLLLTLLLTLLQARTAAEGLCFLHPLLHDAAFSHTAASPTALHSPLSPSTSSSPFLSRYTRP
jgi:hypothetical protein